MNKPPSHHHHNCRCSWIEDDTLAEKLLDIADALLHPRGQVIQAVGSPAHFSPEVLSRVALALRMSKAPKVLQLRAIAEGWDNVRIVRELY